MNRACSFVPGASPTYSGFGHGSTSQKMWQYDTQCSGSEESLLDCSTQSLAGKQLQHCHHTTRVGVTCQRPQMGELRILGGTGPNAGRLEVFANNAWGTVCTDYWSSNDAQVACRQLGFSATGRHTSWVASYTGRVKAG